MKKKILFGTLFSICIIMLVNTASSIEYKTLEDYNTDLWRSQLDNINNFIEKIRQKFENLKIRSDNIISKKEIKDFSNHLSDLKISILDNPSLPTCIRTIFGFIIGLIFSIIGTIFGIILRRVEKGSIKVCLISSSKLSTILPIERALLSACLTRGFILFSNCFI